MRFADANGDTLDVSTVPPRVANRAGAGPSVAMLATDRTDQDQVLLWFSPGRARMIAAALLNAADDLDPPPTIAATRQPPTEEQP